MFTRSRSRPSDTGGVARPRLPAQPQGRGRTFFGIWRQLALLLLLVLPVQAQPSAQAAAIQQSLTSLDDGGAAARFYHLHGYTLAWSGSPSAVANARIARDVLGRAAQEGLDASRYGVFISGRAVSDDVALSAALLGYMRDVAVGRPDLEALDHDVLLPARPFDAAAMLDDALRGGRLAAMLAALPPAHAGYDALRKALASARDAGARDTFAANMERWRWLPAQLEPDRIMVNAASQQLELWLAGKPVLQSRVIVGKPSTPTPILRTMGVGVTVNPPWTVPHSIAVKEILPKLKRNRNYLAGENMILLNGPPGDPHGLSVDWRAIRAGTFPYTIRQLPGPRNSLGQVKLELPNQFDVYLHDTPAKALFARPVRALSHGCVRVEQILPLASYALAADQSVIAAISARMESNQTSYLPFRAHLPVYFLYWTAYPDGNGQLVTLPDIYGRDARLIAAMKAPERIASLDSGCRRG